MLIIGIVLLAVGVVFQIVTLPVSSMLQVVRWTKLSLMVVIRNEEEKHAKKVLNAAAMTYVAAAAVAVLRITTFSVNVYRYEPRRIIKIKNGGR